MADNHHENLIHNSIRNPGLIDYDSSVTWNNRANIIERKLFYDIKKQHDALKSVFAFAFSIHNSIIFTQVFDEHHCKMNYLFRVMYLEGKS